jgi:hypothetical protein
MGTPEMSLKYGSLERACKNRLQLPALVCVKYMVFTTLTLFSNTSSLQCPFNPEYDPLDPLQVLSLQYPPQSVLELSPWLEIERLIHSNLTIYSHTKLRLEERLAAYPSSKFM